MVPGLAPKAGGRSGALSYGQVANINLTLGHPALLQSEEEPTVNHFIEAFRKYATFTGRSRRSEYWYFVLFNLMISIGLFIGGAVFVAASSGSRVGMSLFDAYALGSFVPALAVGVRRLHDIGKSGWFTLLGFVPIANIVLLIWLAQDGQLGTNEYGPNPKDVLAAAA
jgi:uncharacterized membrane protein YhaH (DUF805 family)